MQIKCFRIAKIKIAFFLKESKSLISLMTLFPFGRGITHMVANVVS